MDENLAGITVLDHSSVGPGSRCTAILGDLGATVVKVAPVTGGIEPPWFVYGAGRRTRRARIDLKAPEGRDAFLRLAANADVIVESFRPGVADRLGIGYEAARAVNPRLIYCATTGYGQDGPYAARAGHDINYLAAGGFLSTQGARADGGPAIPGATIADAAGGGMQAAIAICAALVATNSTGEGQFLDVSTTEGVLNLMGLNVEQFLATNEEPRPGSDLLTGKYACYDVYECADGTWLAVGAIEPRFFMTLCDALGIPQEAPNQYVDERQESLRAALRKIFKSKDRDTWVSDLADRDTCVAPVLTVAEVTRDAHLRARGAFASATHPEHGRIEQVAPIVAGSRKSHGEYTLNDGTDTEELLRAAGLSDADVASLKSRGAIA
jgi:alpha-methylacyl-CoA racemase